MLGAFAGRILLVVACGIACVPAAAWPATFCPIDERVGEIEFSVGYLGLFHPSGRFRHFSGSLSLDPAHPERTSMSLDIDAQSVEMSWDEGAAVLRSADYFDVRHYSTISFRSTGIASIGPGRYQVIGSLEIRGVTHLQVLDAVLARTGTGGDAGYIITGKLSRSAFGMMADRAFVSDTVDLIIVARIAPDERLSLGQTPYCLPKLPRRRYCPEQRSMRLWPSRPRSDPRRRALRRRGWHLLRVSSQRDW
jgi:polyisoprenoid-binding protein YceI